MPEDAVDTGDSGIGNKCRPMAQAVQGDPGLFGHRQVGSTGGNKQNHRFVLCRYDLVFVAAQHPCCFMVVQLRQGRAYDFRLLLVHPGCQHDLILIQLCRQDVDKLFGGFILGKNCFRNAGAQATVVIQAGGFRMVFRQSAKLIDNIIDTNIALLQLLQECMQFLFIHKFVTYHGGKAR